MQNYPKFSDLLGLTLTAVDVGDDEIIFTVDDGRQFKLYHEQDCCECVTIESIVGDVKDLIGNPITLAEESTTEGEYLPFGDSSTWTFYKLATIKGYVDIRWYGTSNGYYSESVDFRQIA